MKPTLGNEKIKKYFSQLPFVVWLVLPLAIYFSFALYHVTHFKTADEVLWIAPSGEDAQNRIPAYWQALAKQDWLGTKINDKPGITLAWTAGIGLLWGDNLVKPEIQKMTQHYRQTDTARFEQLMLHFRLPIIILNALFSLFFFWAIRKLTENKWLALFAATLILLCPVLLGISQIINPDSLLWIFSFAALLCYLIFLKTETKKYAALSSLFLGLSLATKYTADIMLPFFFLISVIYIFAYREDWKDGAALKKYVTRIFLAFPLIIIGALAVFALLMPAVFVDPYLLVQKTILYKGLYKYLLTALVFGALMLWDLHFAKGKYSNWLIEKTRPAAKYIPAIIYAIVAGLLLLALANWSIGGNFMHIKNLAFDIGRDKQFRIQDFSDRFFLELRPIAFAMTPLVLFLILWTWIKSIFKKTRYDFVVLVCTLFFIIFIAAVLRSDLLITIRYSIIIYPLILLVAAIGLDDIIKSKRLEKIGQVWIYIILITVSLVSLWQIKPFYFNYTNDLLPKKNNIAGAWGYGGYEAAQYLNNLPNAKNTVIWSDYDGVCEFYVGKCMENKDLHWSLAERDIKDMNIAYYVKTRRGSTRFKNEWKLIRKHLPFDKKPLWNLNIGDRPANYIQVLKVM